MGDILLKAICDKIGYEIEREIGGQYMLYNEISIDSGMGFSWAAVPAQPEKRYNSYERLGICVNGLMFECCTNRNCQLTFLEMRPELGFYYDRLRALYHYPLFQARELVKMICCCAFNDSLLTDDESICIMETCLDPRLDNTLLEVNYNEGW